ncbi:hypothetical protein EDD22DRAFT_959583, partial [Suillus occidentalis]
TEPHRSSKPRRASPPSRAAPPPCAKPTLSPVAQVIASAVATAPASSAPPAPPTPSPSPDTGAEIDNLIAESEQMDIEAEARRLGFSTADLFGRVLIVSSLTNTLLIIALLIGAMHSMNIQSECASS